MKYLVLSLLIASLSTTTFSMDKSLCGPDNRVPSNDSKVGRLLSGLDARIGCTATMISDRCAITAGHCTKSAKILEFNVPMSDSNGFIAHPLAKDIYEVDEIIDSEYVLQGNDFMVLTLKKHSETGLYPGAVQGHYEIDYDSVVEGTPLRISGYGKSDNPEFFAIQQSAVGYLLYKTYGPSLSHDVDTMGGNSGAAIINELNEKIIGVHTNGGCNYGSNSGTGIRYHWRFKAAIEKCLAENP